MMVPKLIEKEGERIDCYLDARSPVTENLSSSKAIVYSGEKKDE